MVDFDVNVKLQAGNAQSQLRQMERGLQSVETQAQKATGGFSLMGSAVTGAMTALSNTAISAATTALNKLTQAAIGSVQVFAGFEKSMSNVAALSGAVGSEFDSLKQKAKDLGATTRFSASEVADAMGFLAMAGFETNEILDSTQTMLDLAAAGNLDLARAADIASNVMGQFGISAQDAERVTNVLAATATSANTTVDQLAEAMNYLGPTANSLGVSLEETAAVIGVLGDSGIQASAAGRALGSALVRLADDSNAKVQGAIEELGLAVFDANGEFAGMEGLLRQIEEGLSSYTDEQKVATLNALLGAEAYQEINILLKRGSEAYAEYRDSITDTNRAAEIAETQSDNLAGAWKSLQSATEALRIEFGEQLSPVITDLVGFLANLAREFVGSGNAENFAKQMAEQLKDALDNVKASFEGVDFPKLADDLAKTTGNLIKLAEGVMAVVKAIELFNRYTFQPSPLPDGFYNENNQIDIRGVINQTNPMGSNKWSLDQTNYDPQRAYGVGSDLFDPSLYTNPVPKNAGNPPISNLNSALPPAPSTTGTSATSAMNSAAQQATSKAQAIASAARQLGITPLELAAIIDLESSFNPAANNGYYSHKNGPHLGLWQAGQAERAWAINQLGLPSNTDWRQVPFETQMAILPAWAASQGYDPGMGQAQLYSTILTGSPGNFNSPDKNKTTVENAGIGPGQRHWVAAEKWLAGQNYTGGTNEYLEALAQSLFNQEPFLTSPMAVSPWSDSLNMAGLVKEARKQVALENFDEANRGLLEQIELIERKLELADMDATQREHILEIEALERESRAQLAEREEQLNELVKEGAFNDDEKAQQLAELITILERYKLAVLDTQEAEQKAIELQELNTQLQEQAQKRMERIAEQQARAREYVDQLTNGFTNLAVSVISGASSMEQALSQFFNTILSYLANQAFQSLFGSLFNGLFGLGGGGVAATGRDIASSFVSGAIGYANGGVISGGFQAFANGGVVTRPTLGLIGEGSMNEAVVPLPDGRRIPVQMQGGGGTNITVNVNNPSSGEDGRRLGRQISEAIKAELVQQSRVGGLLRR